MTPAELIVTKLKAQLEGNGATLPVESLLLEALEGQKREVSSSGIVLAAFLDEQLTEGFPRYRFTIRAQLVVAIDDDKSGATFRENYDVLWATFDALCRGDACTAIGDENDQTETHVFAVDGFQLSENNEPDYQIDENGGTWTTSFAATITGRAN